MQVARKHSAIFFLLFGMALFGSATPISKLVGVGFPIYTGSLLRVILGALFLLPFIYKEICPEVKKIKKREWLYISLISVFGMVGFTLFLIWGMQSVTGVVGSLIMSLAPSLTALGAFLFLRSPLGYRRIIALILGLGGVLVINIYGEKFGIKQSFESYVGMGLVFLAICCESIYTLAGKKVADSIDPLIVTFLASVLSIPIFLVLALFDFSTVSWGAVSIKSWLSLIWWGAGTLGLGSALWYTGLSKTDGSTAAGFMSIMPVTALVLSYFLLDEKFYYVHILGIVLVFSSVAIMSWVHAHERN